MARKDPSAAEREWQAIEQYLAVAIEFHDLGAKGNPDRPGRSPRNRPAARSRRKPDGRPERPWRSRDI